MLCWNVRGLNAPIRRCTVTDMATAVKATIVCLQEMKLQHIDESIIAELLGARFRTSFSFLLTLGTCGGILIVVSDDHFCLQAEQIKP
jgi:exonuclease III